MTSADCTCIPNRFTCGYCLRNAKPWHYTLSDGSAIVGNAAVSLVSQSAERKNDICESWTCTRPHEIRRTGPVFATFHIDAPGTPAVRIFCEQGRHRSCTGQRDNPRWPCACECHP